MMFFSVSFGYSYVNGLVQDCSNSIANALELLQNFDISTVYTYSVVHDLRLPHMFL